MIQHAALLCIDCQEVKGVVACIMNVVNAWIDGRVAKHVGLQWSQR